MQFAADVQFDHLGVFVYSDSEDLPSHKLSGHVPETVAKRRYDAIMSRQVELSRDNNRKYIGRTLQVLVEEKSEENVYLGRTMCQAPEVDGITFIRSGKLAVGDFADVRMVDALEYDLVGEA
jgi:ribosomal protein S12 methylthiotransferase